MKNINEAHLTRPQKDQINNFITHHSFKKKDQSILVTSGQAQYGQIWPRIHNRLLEMKQKRTKEIKKELRDKDETEFLGRNQELDRIFNRIIAKKEEVLNNFTEQYLEDLLV